MLWNAEPRCRTARVSPACPSPQAQWRSTASFRSLITKPIKSRARAKNVVVTESDNRRHSVGDDTIGLNAEIHKKSKCLAVKDPAELPGPSRPGRCGAQRP
jgi:hypothetical protein